MADVSVEFGATDTGLQKTLETIQRQMSSLQGEVDSGTLSFQEINQKMRELRQAEGIFTKLGGEVSEATKSAKEFENQIRLAEAVTKSNRTALEIYSEEVDKLGKLLDSGLISQKTYAAAIEKAEAALKAATPQTEEAKRANEELEASLKLAEAETRALAEEQRKAEAITKANRSATEIYNQEIEELQKHLSGGRISMETFEKAVAKADAKLAAAIPQVEELGNDIDRAGEKAKSAAGIFDSEFQKIAGAFTVGNLAAQGFQKVIDLAFDAARNVVQGFSDALDLGGRLNELSSRTGETAGKLLVLETAFKNSGLEASTVGTAINKLQNFMQDAANGGEKQRAAMQSLGVSMSELAGKTPTEQMKIFADRIAGIEDPTARAAAASEVFGDKLGGKLLPLFSDFSTNLEDARAKVGSLEEVMDENSATFDAAAETIEAVKGKMAAFAAGILSETIPAVRQLGSEMEQIDAAGLGETVGKILSPALRDFTRDVQILLTIFDGLRQQFGDLGSALVGGADNFRKITEEANKYLQVLAALLPGGLNPANLAIKGLAETTKDLSTQTGTATGKVDDLGTSAQTAGQNIANAFSITSDFSPKLDEIKESWGGVNEQILDGKNLLTDSYNLSDSMAGKIGEQADGFGGINEQLTASKDLSKLIDDTYGSHADKLREIQEKHDALSSKEGERKEKLREALDFELQINQAKAAGDTELVKTLENQKLFNAELQKAIDAGMGEKQAAAFAQQMVNAKNAANSIADRNVSVSVTTKVDDTRWKQLLADIAANADPKAVKVALEVTGKEKLSDAYTTLQNMEAINKNYTAAFSAIGAKSIEEVKQNLDGIPTEAQRQLALRITGEDDFDRAVQKLDSFTGTKEARLLLQAQGFDTMDAFQKQLEGITGEKRTDLILNALGVDTVDDAVDALDAILKANGKSATVQVGADTTAATQKLDSLGAAAVTVPIDADTASASAKLDALAKPIVLSLDTSGVAAAISDIQTQIQNSFFGGAGGTGGIGGTGGQGGAGGNATANMGTLQKLVEAIKDAVEKIEPKLPQTALV